MRYYILRPGSPSYIWAEWATPARESAWAEEHPDEYGDRRRGLGGASPEVDDKILIRDELLADPDYAEALRRWEAKDDAEFETQDTAKRLKAAREDAERDAANGCSEAAWLLRRLEEPDLNLNPELVYDFVTGHAHTDCGWVLESV